jgi:hypothetical protein
MAPAQIRSWRLWFRHGLFPVQVLSRISDLHEVLHAMLALNCMLTTNAGLFKSKGEKDRAWPWQTNLCDLRNPSGRRDTCQENTDKDPVFGFMPIGIPPISAVQQQAKGSKVFLVSLLEASKLSEKLAEREPSNLRRKRIAARELLLYSRCLPCPANAIRQQ